MSKMPKYSNGGCSKPRDEAKGLNGNKTPTITIEMHVNNNHALGLLLKKGTLAVRITNTTKISVAID